MKTIEELSKIEEKKDWSVVIFKDKEYYLSNITFEEWKNTVRQEGYEEGRNNIRCGKLVDEIAICNVKLDCHLHDWRQKDKINQARADLIKELRNVIEQETENVTYETGEGMLTLKDRILKLLEDKSK